MIKTTYQTPELRDSNDNIVQEGAFGKNTALSNSDNTGWIDYVVNNLEALHDTIGDSAAHLDGNGHVVEPANLAIGDEDGNRIKTSYLKLTGGTVAGTVNIKQSLKIQDNQENVFGGFYVPASSATSQYLQIYGGENASAGNANIVLRPSGDGRFSITAYNSDGSSTYQLGSNNSGQLYWRGYELAWKKDYLALTGGTLTGDVSTNYQYFSIKSTYTNNAGGTTLRGGTNYADGASFTVYGKNHSSAGQFNAVAHDGTNYKILNGRPDGTLTWDGQSVEIVSAKIFSSQSYVRYKSGLQICYGIVGNMTSSGITVTFPQPFLSAPIPAFSTASTAYTYLTALTATDMTIKTSTNDGYVRYMAIGRWQ